MVRHTQNRREPVLIIILKFISIHFLGAVIMAHVSANVFYKLSIETQDLSERIPPFWVGGYSPFSNRITNHVTLKFTNFCILCLGSLKSMMQRYIFLTNVLNSLPFDYNEGWFSQFAQVLKHPTKHKCKKGREEEVCQGF